MEVTNYYLGRRNEENSEYCLKCVKKQINIYFAEVSLFLCKYIIEPLVTKTFKFLMESKMALNLNKSIIFK